DSIRGHYQAYFADLAPAPLAADNDLQTTARKHLGRNILQQRAFLHNLDHLTNRLGFREFRLAENMDQSVPINLTDTSGVDASHQLDNRFSNSSLEKRQLDRPRGNLRSIQPGKLGIQPVGNDVELLLAQRRKHLPDHLLSHQSLTQDHDDQNQCFTDIDQLNVFETSH